MRAAYYSKSGPAHEVIQFGEFDTPRPGPDEVLVRVNMSGGNPSDIKSRTTSFARVKHLLQPYSAYGRGRNCRGSRK